MSHKKANRDTNTEKGTYLVARDRERLYSEVRHTDPEKVKAEAKRLAKNLNQRILILKVVGVIDKRGSDTTGEDQP